MKRHSTEGRFAERVVSGVDDRGAEERIVIWIERKAGALWAVGRAVNPQHRSTDDARSGDYLFEGYELEDDLRVSTQDGRAAAAEPFSREELLKPLERWFFGRR